MTEHDIPLLCSGCGDEVGHPDQCRCETCKEIYCESCMVDDETCQYCREHEENDGPDDGNAYHEWRDRALDSDLGMGSQAHKPIMTLRECMDAEGGE